MMYLVSGLGVQTGWFIVRDHMELSPFQKVPEVFDGQINGEKFTVKCTVSDL